MTDEFFDDTTVFATFTYLARLAAAEDIIVRWNTRGMEEPARMDMARRILDIAPIKKGQEFRIPARVYHEICHFLFSQDFSKKLNGSQITSIDETKYQEFVGKIRSPYVWNLIEDGYIDRRGAMRLPGILKHFRADFEADLSEYKLTGNVILDTLNTLHMNVLGCKWGMKFEYPKRLPQKLLDLLQKATRDFGSEWDRVELTSQIMDEIEKLPQWKNLQHEFARTKFESPQEDDSIESGNLPADAQQQALVDKAAIVPRMGPRKSSQSPTRLAGIGPVEKESELKDEGVEIEDNLPTLQEYISDNAARVLGTNRYYLEKIVDRSPTGEERYIPTPDEVKLVSDVTDIFHPTLDRCLANMSFNRFAMKIQGTGEGKRFFNVFSKKMEQSKMVAQSMYQRFVTRANAQNIAMAKRKDTGRLDPTRASLYKIYDDIFERRQQLPNQINHGYIVMVDWSASMAGSAIELYHRICELTHFAKLAKVELELWLYTTNDRMIRGDEIARVQDRLREDVMLTGSVFAKIANTRIHHADQLMYRLFFMYVISLANKGAAKNSLRDSMKWFWDEFDVDFVSTVYIPMSGTNIFEALTFAVDRARLLRTDKKAVMLLTDGDDSSTFAVVMKHGERSHATKINSDLSHVMYKGIDLLAMAATAEAHVQSGDNKYGSDNPFKNLRVAASYLVAEDARKDGVPIIGITWGSITSRELELITRNNTIRLSVSQRTLQSKNPTVYEQVTNTFITKITEALLANVS